jgi:hypothetical protein
MVEQILTFMWITVVGLVVYLLMGLMISLIMPKKIRDCDDLCNAGILLWPIVLPVRIIVVVSKFVICLLASLKEVYIEIFKD